MTGNAYYFTLCSVVLCHGAKLFPLSPTISVQRVDGKAFYDHGNFAEDASSVGKTQPGVTVYDGDDKDGYHFSHPDEDDAEGSSTTLPSMPTTSNMTVDAVVDATQAPSGNIEDSPAVTGSASVPSDSADGGSLPGSPAEGESDPTPNPGDAVPGQPGDAPSSSESSSSSSSEEDEFRSVWGKAWQYKIRNELILMPGKSKDEGRIYSPLLTTHGRFAK